MTVDFARTKRRHLAFGIGPHTCIGNNLARREIRIFLEEWMARIPDFRLTPGTVPKMTTGLVNSMEELHLSWDA
jgi:cytochrome P450